MKPQINKEKIFEYHDLVFNKHLPKIAAEKYIGEGYIQHNPNASGGKSSFVNHFESFFKEFPSFKVKVHRVVAENDMVFLHVHTKKDSSDLGDAVVDIYKMKNGKIIEHWDVIQTIYPNSVNPLAFF